jgi:hypothetical protein
MSLQAFERPSIAKQFFLKITGDSDPVAAIKQLANPTPPQFETEWLDFKGAAQITDADVKKTWSEALAGFANTQGGILIWGVDARKNQATGVDSTCGLSLVKNLSGFKSRLIELHRQATEPPVLGVEIETYSTGGFQDEGFVICFIPESPFKPHRAEQSNRQYIIRAGDNFATASVSLLRNLFFPQSRCLLVPTLKARCIVQNTITEYRINGFLKNTGSATAFDTFVITHSDPKGASHTLEDWETGSLVPNTVRAKKPIHPGVSMHFFQTGYLPQTQPTFRIQIFAQDAEPAEWLIHFTEDEMKAEAEKTGERLSLHLPAE